jgi:hypothetical protein
MRRTEATPAAALPHTRIARRIEGLPTTSFVSRAGKVVFVHTDQYETQRTLDHDIATYALGG